MLEKIFKLKEHNTTVRTEIVAGITTFMTMAYILAVNPAVLSTTGMDIGALVTATAVSAIIGTLIMALYANLPFGLAPGMGLNAFFAYTVVLTMGYSWHFALTAVFLEGIIFILLTITNIREAIVTAIPHTLKQAISCGIGLFIAFIGLMNGNIVQSGMQVTPDGKSLSGIALTISPASPEAILTYIGIIIGGYLLIKKVKGALLVAIVSCAILGIPLGITHIPENFRLITLPPSLSPIFCKFQWEHIFSLNMVVIVLTFLFIDLFDTVGTLIGVGSKANMIDKDGKLPNMKQALMADAVATTAGAMCGTSAVTTFVESAAGVAEGGRTGLTAFTVAIMFCLALFFAPIFVIIPSSATAPALILVGLFMMTPILKIDFEDYSESIPAFLAIIMMPLAYSIAEGIVFGVVTYVFLKLISFKFKDLNLLLIVLAILFILRYFLLS
jgi:adenine/guanine/hypoxanthine permease